MNKEYSVTDGKQLYKDYGLFGDAKHWFASSNSKEGFVSYFDGIFASEQVRYLYILGGGPGSGKSTILKSVAKKALDSGYTAELFHCSSSPFSLDGVIIPELCVSVIDGTAPHTFSPRLAGVRDITVDLQSCWNKNELSKRREEIINLSKRKTYTYKRVYRYLASAGKIGEECDSIIKKCVLLDKLELAVSRIVSKYFVKRFEKPSERNIRLQSALSSDGVVYFDNFTDKDITSYKISDRRDISRYFFDTLLEKTKYRTARCTVSYSPFDTTVIDGIYFPDERVAFSTFAQNFSKIINCERFISADILRGEREKYNFAKKAKQSLINEALCELYEAGRIHESLERAYSPCTDYSAVSGVCKKLLCDIFSY